MALTTKICGQMLPGDEAAFVKLAKDTFPDTTRSMDDATIAQGFKYVAEGGRLRPWSGGVR
jgi:hypothetical protein